MLLFPWLMYWYTFVLLALRCISTAKDPFPLFHAFFGLTKTWMWKSQEFLLQWHWTSCEYKGTNPCLHNHMEFQLGNATHQAAALPICSMDSINGAPVMAVIGSNPQSRQSLILLKQNSLSPVPRCLFPSYSQAFCFSTVTDPLLHKMFLLKKKHIPEESKAHTRCHIVGKNLTQVHLL